ncbi:MAG: hypothetical protein BWK73_33950 [Thiothrix lacustris]|uniref:Uncharacterized protein n=1 Tax=Thiothrix lacustris TaxID=525917 RepID=A0A1Y1QGS5_9GAMM|nr:MAG: hypothetical protein BWK73_33950 [Thiothrix lacustris]
MTNAIQNKPTCIGSQDIQRLAQQGQTRALNARCNAGNVSEKTEKNIGNLLSNCATSIVAGGKPAKPPTTKPSVIAGGKPATPPPTTKPPVIAGGMPVPTKPLEPVVAGGITVQPAPLATC